VLAVVAVANGIFRNTVITPRFGEHLAHIVSTILLCSFIFVLTVVFIRWIAPQGSHEALLIGLFWVVLTLSFEFLAGHYLFGHTWQKLLADYNVLRGRLWILVPLVTFLSPRWALFVRVA